ncbi:MAG: sugar ABC transporter permease [Oscillospiraceae bacterium]|jgi:arabinogalactan oligomer/maltooligosaccharide transport system permease protein|nr:sugar ABC transporter permease [Oscillospiraceae bacterium]
MLKRRLAPWLYSTPLFIIIVAVILFPIAYTLYISFTNMNVYHWFEFETIGLENYKKALLMLDSGFLPAVLRTILWTAVNIVLQVIIAFFLALGLNSPGLKARTFYKTMLMFPWAMPAYVSILLWRMGMFNTEFGFLNKLLEMLGFSGINYLSNSTNAFISCVVVNLWQALPFMLIMMDSALQSIDKSYYESALLDGAGFWKRHLNLTLPAIRPIMAAPILMTTFLTFKQFDIVYLLTMQRGGVTGANINTVLTYVYDKAFITNNYGYSSAASILVFVLIIILSSLSRSTLKQEGV